MKRAALRSSELCAVELLSAQAFSSIYELTALSVSHLSLPVDVTFEGFSSFTKKTGVALSDPTPEGMTVRHAGRYFVLYNDRTENERRRTFTLAHELGHIMLGHTGEDEMTEEREANAFAASLLSPAIVFHYLTFRDGRVPSVEEMMATFPLSREAAENRVRDLCRKRPARPADCEITLLLHLFGKIPQTFPK